MSKGYKYNIFLISKVLTGILRAPIQTFISKDYNTAKLFFQDWLLNNKKEEKSNYILYKIGEIGNDLKIEECKIYITGAFEQRNQNIEFKREKIKEEKKQIEEASKQKTTKDILKILFGGKEIEE